MSDRIKSRRITSNAYVPITDVAIQPADTAVALAPCDSKGNRLGVVEAGYRGVLPLDGMPAQLVVSNGKVTAEYSHGTDNSFIVKHYQDQRVIYRLDRQLDLLKRELAMLGVQPPVIYRHTWPVKAAAAVVAFFAELTARFDKQ